MQGHILAEGEYGQRFLERRFQLLFNRAEIAGRATAFETLADIVMSNDRSIFLKVGIAVGVIEMIMRIDDEAHGFVCYSFERGFDPVGERGELIIYEDGGVVADAGAH